LDGEIARVVVTELLQYPQDERWNYVALLKAVNAPQCSFNSVHVAPSVVYGDSVISSLKHASRKLVHTDPLQFDPM
jgi:hypothetical protein